MKVFLSWSGHSRAVAIALDDWLKKVINAIDPFLSTRMPKGTSGTQHIATELAETKVGIICLTRDAVSAPWILFEAGALSKTTDAVVCTLLVDIERTDLSGSPLERFQYTIATDKEDMRKMVGDINEVVRAQGEPALDSKRLDDVFDLLWDSLRVRIAAAIVAANKEAPKEEQSEHDLLKLLLAQQQEQLDVFVSILNDARTMNVAASESFRGYLNGRLNDLELRIRQLADKRGLMSDSPPTYSPSPFGHSPHIIPTVGDSRHIGQVWQGSLRSPVSQERIESLLSRFREFPETVRVEATPAGPTHTAVRLEFRQPVSRERFTEMLGDLGNRPDMYPRNFHPLDWNEPTTALRPADDPYGT